MQSDSELTMQVNLADEAAKNGGTGAPSLTPFALMPVSIVALGPFSQPVERLMAVQSAVAKLVDLLTTPGFALPHSLRAWLRAT